MPNDIAICGFPGLTSLPITLVGNPILTSGIPPFTYHWSTDLFWSPPISIFNPNTLSPLVFPDSSITYNLMLTDSAACQVSSSCIVYVNPLAIEKIVHNKNISLK